MSFLPLFVSTASGMPPIFQMLLLSAVFMGITLIIFILYGIWAHSVRSYMTRAPKRILRLQRSLAVLFVLLGVKLALARQ